MTLSHVSHVTLSSVGDESAQPRRWPALHLSVQGCRLCEHFLPYLRGPSWGDMALTVTAEQEEQAVLLTSQPASPFLFCRNWVTHLDPATKGYC